jgi:hypothetical protein
MCFDKICYTKIKPRPKVAKEDITVFKLIGVGGNGMYYDLYINGKKEKWTPGYWYTEDTPFKGAFWNASTKFLSIEGNAFHSLKTMKIALDKQYFWNNMKIVNMTIVKMIIPKGALYYENEKEYVSSQIIYPK